jgi:hypothetical protein
LVWALQVTDPLYLYGYGCDSNDNDNNGQVRGAGLTGAGRPHEALAGR